MPTPNCGEIKTPTIEFHSWPLWPHLASTVSFGLRGLILASKASFGLNSHIRPLWPYPGLIRSPQPYPGLNDLNDLVWPLRPRLGLNGLILTSMASFGLHGLILVSMTLFGLYGLVWPLRPCLGLLDLNPTSTASYDLNGLDGLV